MALKFTLKPSGLWVRAKSTVARSSRLLNCPCRLSKLSPHQIGALGEKIAARYLQSLGWKVLFRNFRAPEGGEVDLVLRGGDHLDLLVFAEVKTRTRRDYGRPIRAVNAEKRALITRGATEWLRLLGKEVRPGKNQDVRREISWRYDVVEIVLEEGAKPDVNLVESAF
ncbi:YraN family protein [Akkermansiaceae bacterium]|jgi:putative endonuclease|nr:YraN family protein [Akkermansiaceae bacterium]